MNRPPSEQGAPVDVCCRLPLRPLGTAAAPESVNSGPDPVADSCSCPGPPPLARRLPAKRRGSVRVRYRLRQEPGGAGGFPSLFMAAGGGDPPSTSPSFGGKSGQPSPSPRAAPVWSCRFGVRFHSPPFPRPLPPSFPPPLEHPVGLRGRGGRTPNEPRLSTRPLQSTAAIRGRLDGSSLLDADTRATAAWTRSWGRGDRVLFAEPCKALPRRYPSQGCYHVVSSPPPPSLG